MWRKIIVMKKIYLFLAFVAFTFLANAQFSLSGKITDENGDPMVGASVQILEKNLGTVTNADGFYELINLAEGQYAVESSFIGYKKSTQTIAVNKNSSLNFSLVPTTFMAEEVIVKSTRADEKTPVTYSMVDRKDLGKNNVGQDFPYLISMEPSMVTSSDGGTGIGYTGMWIRGSNIQRINVTVNGIPLNDPESHGVFWVNMPDFTSSVNNAQIQRGVGTSTNGGGAFGATINMETSTLESKPFTEINSSAGSFNTFKNNVRFGTGLIKGKWAFEGRLSKITSDGYVDRASSDLKSFFVQGGYYTNNTTLKAIVFSGKEKTYQAWYGVDDWTVENYGRTFNWAGVIYNEDGSMRYYDNETDNYQQDHYQLHFSQKILEGLKFNAALHYTYGRGYYEEYYQGATLADYPIGTLYFGHDSTLNANGAYDYFYHDSVTNGDLIGRRWLDNQFYGSTYSLDYTHKNLNLNFGGAINKYAHAKHYGELIWAQYAGNTGLGDRFYNNESDKTDFNNYLKANWQLDKFNLFGDLQLRKVIYTGSGTDDGGVLINIDENYTFFNPKIGLTYEVGNIGDLYSSFAIANREPIRTDFTDAPDGTKPEPEHLSDFEMGMRNKGSHGFYNANFYYMKYTNQLALTGELNDVGSPIRANVGKSYRMGIELDGGYEPVKWFAFRSNLALSNSNTDYNEQVNGEIIPHNNVQLSFSPQVVGGIELNFTPFNNFEAGLSTKYISKQYLDLTQNEDLTLDPYSYTNINLSYTLKPKLMDEMQFTLLICNVFNQMYSSNGYVWDGVKYYYPQAGINFLAGIKLRF